MGRLLKVVATTLVLVPQSSQAGVVYSARMEKLGKESTFNVWATDTRAKFSVSESGDSTMPTGFSVIALDRGERYIVLYPDRQAFIELTRSQFRNLMRKQAEARGVKIEDSKVEEMVVDSDGGLVAGIKTRYYKVRMSVRAEEEGQRMDLVAVEEFWSAPSVPNPAPSLDMLTQQTSGLDQFDAVLNYKGLNGFPLRRVVQLYANGQFVGNSLVEITKISQVSIPDSVFDVPSDYKKLAVSSGQPK